MKKAVKRSGDDLRREYDFASMVGEVRGKYVSRLKSGSNLVLLDPDVAEAFPSGEAVNEALRAAIGLANTVGGRSERTGRASRRAHSRGASGKKGPGRAARR